MMRFPLRVKFSLIMVLVLVGSIGFVTWLATSLFIHDKSTYIFNLNSVTARDRSVAVSSSLEHLREKMRIFSKTYRAQFKDKREKQNLLNSFFRQYQEFLALSIYPVDGGPPQQLFQSNKLTALKIRMPVYDKHLEKVGLSIKDVLNGETFFVNATVDRRVPAFAMAVPINATEIAVGVIDIRQLEPSEETERIQEILIVDNKGRVVFHTDPDPMIVQDDYSDREIVKTMFANSEHVLYGLREYDAPNGDRLLGAFALLNRNQGGVIVQVPKSVAFQGAREFIGKICYVAFVILVLGCVIALILSNSITKPIMHLARATRNIAQGDFKLRLRSSSSDEIGDLARDFNQMGRGLLERDQALEEANSKLIQSEKMAAFGQLGAGIAHEVKNPLAGILGYVQLSKKKIPEDHPISKNLNIIEKETKRCKEIIENLLKFARQEKASLQRMDVNVTVRDAVVLVEHQLTINQVKIFRDIPETPNYIIGNSNQLQQVLMNLMINAQHAMEPNGGELYISTLQANGFAEIHLRDTGKGIAPEVKARIFEPFFTTKPAGKGTGLGLSVTFGIIKDHQGEVIVESEVGKGTEFIIRIPSLVGQAQVSASDEDKKAQAGGNATSTSGPGEAGINV